MKNLKIYLIILFLLIIYILFSAVTYANAVCSNISDSVFRLHIIANSNSVQDQNLKYIVRDEVLKYFNEIVKDNTSKNEIKEILSSHLADIEALAKETVLKNGYNYDISVEIGNFSFPTKTYGDISFPSGFYDALRIKIGNAEGKNWWCVMFPPLCFIDVTSGIVPDESKELIESNLSDEEFKLISEKNNNNTVKIKFKIVEVLQNLSIRGIFM